MPVQPGVGIEVSVSQKDIARITKRLDKWQGRKLAQRMDKATRGGLGLVTGPLRAASPKASGELRASVKITKLRKRPGEVAAYAIYPRKRVKAKQGTALLAALIVHGVPVRNMAPNPYISRVERQLEPAVTAFIETQIRRLA